MYCIYCNYNIDSDLVPYTILSLLAVYLTIREVLALLGFLIRIFLFNH
jgi:hypothetical protein